VAFGGWMIGGNLHWGKVLAFGGKMHNIQYIFVYTGLYFSHMIFPKFVILPTKNIVNEFDFKK
jgi:hypothetical protein